MELQVNTIGSFSLTTTSKINKHDSTHNNEPNAIAATILNNKFPSETVPMEVNGRRSLEIEGQEYDMLVEDTLAIAGLIEGKKNKQAQSFLRSQYGANEDQVWLLIFALTDLRTLEFIERDVYPHLQLLSLAKFKQNPKCVLVGTQIAASKKQRENVVTEKEAKRVAKQLGCFNYVEIETEEKSGIESLYEAIVGCKKANFPKTSHKYSRMLEF